MKCEVMAIINVTPDSFSDGGQYYKPEEALKRAKNAIEEGATVLDFGGESTRPGSTPLTWQEEWARLEPILSQLKVPEDVAISVDTYHPETAERAIALGVTILNCVYPEPIPAFLALLKRFPRTELILPWSCVTDAEALGLAEFGSRLIYDPMIGFGTSREEDLELLQRIPEMKKAGRVLIGASRKRIVKKLTGEKVTGKNLGGNLAIALWSAAQGADYVRVHDVRETYQAIRVWEQLAAK